MAAPVIQTDFVKGIKVQPVSVDGETVTVRAAITLPAGRAANDVYSLLLLPADHMPVDVIVDVDDVDTGSSYTFSVGIMTPDQSDLSVLAADGGAVWISGASTGQAGGIVRPTAVPITRCAPSNTVRYIGVKNIVAGSATAGTLGITLTYRRSGYGT